MTVYVDHYRQKYGRMRMSHMIADTASELHAMASSIGLQRKWFQAHASFPHYDVSDTKRQAAIRAGAVEVDRHGMVEAMRRIRGCGEAATGFVFRKKKVQP